MENYRKIILPAEENPDDELLNIKDKINSKISNGALRKINSRFPLILLIAKSGSLKIIISLIVLTIFSGINIYGQEQSKPKVIILDTCPKPQKIAVPSKPGGFYLGFFANETKKIELQPPFIKDLNEVHVESQGLCFFTNYTSDNGLALDHVVSSFRDKIGNLWFGTSGGGLSRYDGKSFTNFTTAQGLINNFVLSITGDETGSIWLATAGGVSRYDGNSFINFTTAQGLVHNMVMSVTVDKTGNMWFGTEGGVSRYDGKSFTNFTTAQGLASNMVMSIMEDKTGNLWFGTYKGLSRYDGKSFTNFTTAQGLVDNVIRAVKEDKSGNIWLGTSAGISRYDGKSFTNFSTAQGLISNFVRYITEDESGNLWIGTNNGISRFDGKSFANFTTTQGLANNRIKCITYEEGNLWFGTNGGGVSRYGGKAFINFTTAQGLANNIVLSIEEDKKGNLWFGTYGGGVSRYDGSSFTNFTISQGLTNNNVLCMEEDKTGNLWFGTYGGGVSCYDGKSFTNYTTIQGLAHDKVWCIRKDKTGDLWFGTEGNGISRFDGKSFTNFSTSQGLANNVVRCITEDKTGNLWFGTNGGGVSRYDGKSFTGFTTAQGLANNVVWSIMEDKENNLWFGTEGGVSRYDGKSFTNFTTKDGLSNNIITCILEDNSGRIFLGTNKGINVITGWNKGAPIIEIYNSESGHPIKDINMGQDAMFKDSKGIIWAGTGADKTGLVRIDYSTIKKNPNPLVVILRNIKVHNENISWYNLARNKASDRRNTKEKQSLESNDSLSIEKRRIDSLLELSQEALIFNQLLSDEERARIYNNFSDIRFDGISKFYNMPENLVLPYKHNNITFDFVGIEPVSPFSVRYQYILEGYDENWSPVTDKTSASFGNIREGTYTFKLRASRTNGVWSETVSYTFKVLPPWYRTWWSYIFYFILLVVFITFMIKYYTRALIKKNEHLEELVHERNLELEDKVEILNKTNTELQSERQKLEASNKELESFAYSVSHDLRAPLRHIIGFSDKLKSNIKSESSSEVERLTNKIINSGKNMSHLIDNLLSYSRLGRASMEMRRVSLQNIVDEVKKEYQDAISRRNVEWIVNQLPEVQADITQIRFVFQNLIDNALKYTNKNDKAVIEIGYNEKDGKEYVFYVKDNGVGFNMEYSDKLFGVFQRLHSSEEFEGTGIGLANVRRIILRHGGRVWAEGKENEGAVFYFTIPK